MGVSDAYASQLVQIKRVQEFPDMLLAKTRFGHHTDGLIHVVSVQTYAHGHDLLPIAYLELPLAALIALNQDRGVREGLSILPNELLECSFHSHRWVRHVHIRWELIMNNRKRDASRKFGGEKRHCQWPHRSIVCV
jgi:hypothetical protein